MYIEINWVLSLYKDHYNNNFWIEGLFVKIIGDEPRRANFYVARAEPSAYESRAQPRGRFLLTSRADLERRGREPRRARAGISRSCRPMT